MDIKQIIKKQIENGLIHPNDGATKEGFEMGYKYAKSEQLRLHNVSQEKRTVCPDCGDYGWIYSDDGTSRKTCPCHY